MGDTLQRVRELVRAGMVKISEHGYDELAADGISAREIVDGLQDALLIEEYPSFAKGPCVLITAYRPNPERWADDFSRRTK
jgi:hypothetical protein